MWSKPEGVISRKHAPARVFPARAGEFTFARVLKVLRKRFEFSPDFIFRSPPGSRGHVNCVAALLLGLIQRLVCAVNPVFHPFSGSKLGYPEAGGNLTQALERQTGDARTQSQGDSQCLKNYEKRTQRNTESLILAVRTGFEPATFCVTGRYANRYTTRPHPLE